MDVRSQVFLLGELHWPTSFNWHSRTEMQIRNSHLQFMIPSDRPFGRQLTLRRVSVMWTFLRDKSRAPLHLQAAAGHSARPLQTNPTHFAALTRSRKRAMRPVASSI